MLKNLTISFFGPIKNNNNPPRISIYDNGTNKSGNLERKDCTKYLGVLIDENLSWRTHIVTVATKISKTIGTLSKLRHFVPSSVLVNIYNALITLYLTYGLISWRNACKTYLDKILILHYAWYILQTDKIMLFRPFLVNSKVLPLNFLYYQSVLNLMHDIDERNTPINILNLFSRTSNSHHYSTRSSTSQNLYIKI